MRVCARYFGPNFAQAILEADPANMLDQLVANYPVRGEGVDNPRIREPCTRVEVNSVSQSVVVVVAVLTIAIPTTAAAATVAA